MGISLNTVNEDLGVTIIDSISVNTSTVQLEYVPSANTGTLLVGKINQAETGAAIASSYFRLALLDFVDNIPDDAKFDSINLVLMPNAARYYYGDTTQNQTLHVHRVTQTIETQNLNTIVGSENVPTYVTGPSIFSYQQFAYEGTALGSLTFKPRVKTIDTLSVRLDDALGQDLFDKINAGNPNVSNNDNFQQYLKGLVLVPDAQNTAIVGLNDTVYVDINYSYMGSDGFIKTGKKTMTTASRAYQYNHIDYDRSGTDFAALNRTNREVKSTVTNGNVYLQAGSGVVAKLEFPSLKQFLNEPNMAINKIELEIETTGSNFGSYPNPNGLMLFIANKYTGVPVSFVRSPRATSIQTASLMPGDMFGKNSKYVFNLIDYIKTINNIAYAETCLYLSVSSPEIFGSTDMAMIAKEDNQPKIKLNIVYTKFK